MAKDEKGITIKKEENFSDWYTQVLQKSELIEYSDVSGCYILRPRSFAVWEFIQKFFDDKIKKSGVRNCYFPLFIPESLLLKEEKHFSGFKAEVAWVTEGGSTKLNERLAVRPTSETIMYATYSKWIRSYNDLPLRLNQWCNVVRWEFKHPVPFLRSREFLWQEGHSAFSTREEAEAETYEILDYYSEVFENLLAIPVLKGMKTTGEKFPGADYTLSVEAILPSGKSVQGATSHCLGQNFSKPFNIKFLTKDEKTDYVYQNSWGISTRSIGIAIMVHSDDKGLVLPPFVAENKLVIVPIMGDKVEAVMKKCKDLEKQLKEFNPILDNRSGYSPGWKFNEWELKGIPLRIELGPKDLEKDQVVVATRHDGKKEFIKLKDIKSKVHEFLEKMQSDLFNKAKKSMNELIVDVSSFKDFEKALNNKKIVKIDWCNEVKCEESIKNKFEGVKSINIPLNSKPKYDKCVVCGNKSNVCCYFGRSY